MLELLQLIAEHLGAVGLIVGIPFVAMGAAIIVLWRQNNKNIERLMKIIEQNVEANTKLEGALDGLKEVIRARG